MAQSFDTVLISGQGVTLSQLLWRQEKAPYPGRVEAVLAANPHLADVGFILPVGTVVRIPVKPSGDPVAQTLTPITLW